jgi:hypothetical protein
MRMKSLLIFMFFFSFTSLTAGAPMSYVTPLNSTTTKPQQSYSDQSPPSSVTNDLDGFLTAMDGTKRKNLCTTFETRDACFVQYMVKKPASSSDPYTQLNKLQCPAGYVTAAYLGNSALDSDNPSDKIYYYEGITIAKATPAQYSAYASSGGCTKQPTAYATTTDCEWKDCGQNSIYGETTGNFFDISGYKVWVKTSAPTSGNYRATWNTSQPGLVKRCDTYTGLMSCSGNSQCTTCRMVVANKFYVSCNVKPGYYLSTSAPSAPVSASHTPSTIICVKPTIKWQAAPAPTTTPKAQS